MTEDAGSGKGDLLRLIRRKLPFSFWIGLIGTFGAVMIVTSLFGPTRGVQAVNEVIDPPLTSAGAVTGFEVSPTPTIEITSPTPLATATSASVGILRQIVSPTAIPPTAAATATAATTATPAKTATPVRVYAPRPAANGVPILMYHYIRVNPDSRDKIGYGLSITPDLFRAHVAFLNERGFHAITMRELAAMLDAKILPPEKSIVLTFDDGYRDAYTEAWPVLKEFGFSATLYVVTDFIELGPYLTRPQIKELHAGGIEIGSHSLAHPNLPALSSQRLTREVVESRGILQELIGAPVISFCYPSGKYNDLVERTVRTAGYTTATTVEHGIIRGKENRMSMPRVRMYGGMGLNSFANLIGEPAPDAAKWRTFLFDRPMP